MRCGKNLWKVALLVAAMGWAQPATYTWNDNACEYKGTYDSKVVSKRQIDDAHALLTMEVLPRNAYFFGEKTVDPARYLPALQTEIQEFQAKVAGLMLPSGPIWESYRSRKLEEIRMQHRVMHFTYAAFSQPRILDTFGIHDSCLDVHARAMGQGGQALLDDWKAWTAVAASRNGSPKQVWKEYQERFDSPQREAFAKFTILNFGWGDCANNHIPRLNTLEQGGEEHKAFRKLFLKVKQTCESQG